MQSLGVDLAGSEKRPTGVCLMDDLLRANTKIIYKDEELIKLAKDTMPDVVAIDAPLSLPKGRTSLYKKEPKHLRECDRQLLRMGIRFFPVTLGPMRLLTERGIRIKSILESFGLKVIEVYPGGAQDVLSIPRKNNLKGLLDGLRKLGVKNLKDGMTSDELDAVTCALVGMMYLKGDYESLGDEDEGTIIMPKVKKI